MSKSLGLLLLVWSVSAEAMNEKTVIDLVKKHHPLIESAKNKVAASRGRLQATQGAFDTSFEIQKTDTTSGYYQNRFTQTALKQPTRIWGTEIEAGYRTGQGDFPSYEGKLQTSSEGEGYVALKVPLLRDGYTDKRRTQIETSQQEVISTEADLSFRINQLIRDSRLNFWDWIGNGYAVEVNEALLKLAEERDSGLRKQFSKGSIPKIQVTDNERLIFQRKNEMQNALKNFIVSSQRLSLFVRDSDGLPRVLERKDLEKDLLGAIPTLKWTEDGAIQMALRLRPEVQSYQAKRTSELAKLRLAKNQLLPDLSLRLEQSRELSERADLGGFLDETRVGVQFELPLWLRTARGLKESSEKEIRAIDRELEFFKETITAQIREKLESIRILSEIFDNAKLEQERAAEVERGERLRFKMGQSDILTLNLREEATARASLRQIKTAIELRKAMVELEFLTGVQIADQHSKK